MDVSVQLCPRRNDAKLMTSCRGHECARLHCSGFYARAFSLPQIRPMVTDRSKVPSKIIEPRSSTDHISLDWFRYQYWMLHFTIDCDDHDKTLTKVHRTYYSFPNTIEHRCRLCMLQDTERHKQQHMTVRLFSLRAPAHRKNTSNAITPS